MKARPLALLAVPLLTASFLVASSSTPASADPSPRANFHAQRVCDPALVRPGEASCHALRLVDATDNAVDPMVTSTGALTPADVRAAYNLTSASSGGKTVAIVDAYGYPKAESDLAVYRSAYGLPACTVANGCLTIVDQNGGSKLPKYNYGWAGEQALDLDAVSATCPDCTILLVQASSASLTDLGTAVNTAARWPGVVAISNSYGGGDLADSSYGSYYNHPGIAVTASTGDNGYQGASYPASSHYVTAVGGTTLQPGTNARGWSETVWSGAGSGCTTLNSAPTGQSASVTGCSGRAMADVAAVADPNTGLRVYGPTRLRGSAWQQYGGTSLSSPIIASVYAMSGNTSGYANQIVYAKSGSLYDITSGSNGSCGPTMCSSGTGWDGPTGLGTPNGTSGF